MEATACKYAGNGMRSYTTGTDFGFRFNDPKCSDRVLRLQFSTDPSEPQLGNPTSRKVLGRPTSFDSGEPEQPLPRHNKRLSNNSASSHSFTDVYINSLVLAAKSPVFYKMFSNGMRESEQQVVTLSIHASEEVALLDFLQFLYTNMLKANTPTDLLKVLMFADRYQVVSCVRYCVTSLSLSPMTLELAVTIMNLPSSISAGYESHLRVLVDAATCTLSKSISSHYVAALHLPLEIIENILSWNTLEVTSEDAVYNFVLMWASIHYKDPCERRQIISSRLCQLIRFPHMSYEKLKTVLECEELVQGEATKMVVEALFLKAENHLPRVLATSSCPARAYMYLPVKVTMLDSPYQQCIVYLELKKEECKKRGQVRQTQEFHVGNECFSFVIQRSPGNTPLSSKLVMYPSGKANRSTTDAVKVKCDFAVRLKCTGEYFSKNTKSLIFNKSGICRGYLVNGPWDSFMGEHSQFLIDGVLYVRFTLTLEQ